jgi:hypothetical protein
MADPWLKDVPEGVRSYLSIHGLLTFVGLQLLAANHNCTALAPLLTDASKAIREAFKNASKQHIDMFLSSAGFSEQLPDLLGLVLTCAFLYLFAYTRFFV